MAVDLQDHVAVRELWKRRQKQFAGGDPWEFECQIDHNHSAQFVGLYETDGSALADTMIKGEIRQRHCNAHYTYDLREKGFQRGGTKIVDLIKTKYVGMMTSFFELLEPALWSEPTDDNKTPFGVGYWVTRNASTGFNGGNPTNFSGGKAGIDCTATGQTRWKNWTARYVAVSKEDLIRKMREASVKTRFRSPVSHAQPTVGGMGNGIYLPYSVLGTIEEILEDQNMNLGNDVASKDGRAQFKGSPLTYVPYLDSDAQYPIYMLDWKWMCIGVMPGWENNLTKPYQVADRHNVRRVDLDASLNMACTNVRRQTVISTA